ncbi:unnamed protein product [Linum tenue]|uniref:DUF1664 domain-containing protein n=1 Tax=Linum tenue TaxID=586396 RepID=A0AAV0HP90_9ROSI|nr:unnamed protein product [Linum tenue]
MAMQAALGSRVLLIAGAGYFGTVLIQKGKLSDLIGELQALVKGIEKGDSDGETGQADVLSQQVRLLAQQVRQLTSARHITVLNTGQSGNFTGYIIPAATVGAVGYGYIWWKGWKLSDLMYVTKQSMTAAVSNLTKHLEGVTDALAKAKEHLTQRIQGLDDKMDKQNELSRKIESDVNAINDNILLLDSGMASLINYVSVLDEKLDSLEGKQSRANLGIQYLCNFVQGKKVKMPEALEEEFLPSRTRSITFHDASGPMGLKALDCFSRSTSVPPVTDGVQLNGEEPQTPSRPLLRYNSAKV